MWLKVISCLFVGLFATSAFADPLPVKDRCGDPEVMKTFAELLDNRFPSKTDEKASFTLDPSSVFTTGYNANLDRVTCEIDMVLHVKEVVVRNKDVAYIVIAANRAGLKELYWHMFYTMQYFSGSDNHFDVAFDHAKLVTDNGRSE